MRSRTRLELERLEARNLLAADPLPVLMVLADHHDFYYQEYGDTRISLEAAGLEVQVAATTTDPTTPHANSGQGGSSGIVVPDLALADVVPADYSAIVFVGGWGASMYQYAFSNGGANFYQNDHYNGDPTTQGIVNDLINDFLAADKHVAAICHGVTVLAWARVEGVSPLAGRQVSIPYVGTPAMFFNGNWYPDLYAQGQYAQVAANGALPNLVSGQYGNPNTVTDDVVVDGRIITAENFDAALAFGQVIAQEVINAANPPPPPPPPPVVDHVAVFRKGRWWYDADGEQDFDEAYTILGKRGDRPVRGDFDHDGVEEIGVFRGAGRWLIDLNHDGLLNDGVYAKYGRLGDRPVVGDWDGDGDDDLGVYRDGRWWLDDGDLARDEAAIHYGGKKYRPVVGDWDSDGRDEIAVFRAGLWYRDDNGDQQLNDAFFASYGQAGDQAVAGDWDGDGDDDLAIFRAGTWYCDDGDLSLANDVAFSYGVQGDTPLAGRW